MVLPACMNTIAFAVSDDVGFLSPSVFLSSMCILCCIEVSFCLGTSFGGISGFGFGFTGCFCGWVIGFGLLTVMVFLIKSIPHFGQVPGFDICTSGCIMHV